ncbi:McrC family protein [Massilia sp. IC2-278]|uniref:McrC family protein n=1 Tax=Massilia sp. IC2-278 TaxID=2887200 RepID=UPI001E2E3CA1|nr:McrC family protein [Massilia sp. IC2-278]MCC2962697.1 McrC family protein [Massilia sp. IC2-278]
MIRLHDNCHAHPLAGLVSVRHLPKKPGVLPALTIGACRAAGNRLFSFHGEDEDRRAKRNGNDELVLALSEEGEAGWVAQTGNYVGRLSYQKHEFDIRSRFGDAFMQRMLNFANDIYVDDWAAPAERIDAATTDYARVLIFMSFVRALEKAFLLGLPKSYRSIQHHDFVVRGRIDIPRMVRDDLPFRGQVASVAREQVPSQAIIDVLARAIQVIDRNGGEQLLRRIAHVRTQLAGARSNRAVDAATIRRAQSDKGLANPIFAPYRKVLDLAETIIALDSARDRPEGSTSMSGLLVNVAELFEVYVGKLLALHFPGWSVSSPAIRLHAGRFYARRIIPDIVMLHEDGRRVAVLDTKYKRMHFQGGSAHGMGDVDREDFFQIATYMSHFDRLPGKRLVLGGLLYPLATEPDPRRCHDAWMGDETTAFVVDGIRVPEGGGEGADDVLASEARFIERLAVLLEDRA